MLHRGLKDNNSDLNIYGRTKLMNIMTSNEFQVPLLFYSYGVAC